MRFLTLGGVPLWRDARVIRAVAEIISVLIVVLVVLFVVNNVLVVAEKRGFSLGFGFLEEEAGFIISASVIEYDAADTFRTAFSAGVLNTLKMHCWVSSWPPPWVSSSEWPASPATGWSARSPTSKSRPSEIFPC